MRFTTGKLSIVLAAAFVMQTAWSQAVAHGSDQNSPQLTHTESVYQATFTGISFGPVGPGCDASAGGPACLFLDATANVVGQHHPFGKFTGSVTATLNLNPTHFIPSGAHDASGNPTGVCTPEFGTETDTFADGSILSSNFQGLGCCAGPDCGGTTGPPSVNHDSSVITNGTGRFAGATGGWSWSDSGTGGPLLIHAEGVLQLLH
jgi:hypothetical protein